MFLFLKGSEKMKGYIMQIQPFSVNDGEGIRTTIFMAGCPLRCKWCSNPEGMTQKPKTAFYEKVCIGCGICTTVCHLHGGINLNEAKQRKICDGCGSCADVCPRHAKKRMIIEKDVSQIVEEVKKHSLFYRQSGGGITFSGGEATMQKEFLEELSLQLYDLGFHLTIETCGYFCFDDVKSILNRMDMIFMDLKHMDNEKHLFFTGVDNKKILENIKRLEAINAEIIIHIPVIKGVNADKENIEKSGVFVHKYLPKAKMELLPYHKFGFGKYEALGLKVPEESFQTPTEQEMKELKKVIQNIGITLVNFQ